MSTLHIFTSVVANQVDDAFAPKGLTILEQSEGGVLVEFTRPRTQKRDRRFIPTAQIIMLSEGTGEADSGFLAAQELASLYSEIEVAEFEVQGDMIVATDEDGQIHRAPCATSYITEMDVVEEAPAKKKPAAKKDKKPAKEEKAPKAKGKGKGKGKKDSDWEE